MIDQVQASADSEQAAKPTALTPRTFITRLSERPTDQAFAYFVRFFKPKGPQRGNLILWTDSEAYAKEFASKNHIFARPSQVEHRNAWDAARSIGLSEHFR